VALAAAAAALALVGLLIHGLERLAARAPEPDTRDGGAAAIVEGEGIRPGAVEVKAGMSLCDLWTAAGGHGDVSPEECTRVARAGTRVSLANGRFQVEELTAEERFAIGSRLDPNHASASELEAIPGLSSTLAGRIVTEREQGLFCSVDDLTRIRGIGARKVEWIRPFLEVVGVPDGCTNSP
jgi:DNA uptake protein ComE-like DNA-binding protein